MKFAAVFFAFLSACAGLGAKPLLVDATCAAVAVRLQRQIPEWSCDQLLEARRTDDGWLYSYWTNYGEDWTIEVRIAVRAEGAGACAITVSTVRVEAGLIGERAVVINSLTDDWTAKIEKFLKEPDQAPVRGSVDRKG